jgi:hypothetical protein
VRVAFFTAGTIGAGHLVKGLSVERGLARVGFRGEFRSFGPLLPFDVAKVRPNHETVDVRSDRTLRDRHLAQMSGLARRLAAFDPDLLLVDLFWAPLRWVLPTLRCEAWLLIRICPEVWLVGSAEMPFDPGQYARVIALEPMPERGQREAIDPLVVCNPEECRPPGALREHLGVPAGETLTVVSHAGERREAEVLAELAGPAARMLNLFEPGALFPAAEWLGGADRLVAGAGYNAFWEAHWLGYASRTRWVPFARPIDDQALRCHDAPAARPRENGADTLARWILAG